MIRNLTLIHPDIDAGEGRVRELIDELATLRLEGECAGGAEIAAVAALLASPGMVPDIAYKIKPGGPIEKLTREYLAFLTEGANTKDPFLVRLGSERGISRLNLHIAGLANATGALFDILMANEVAGGEVITTSLNYTGVVNAIVLAGAEPKFVDVAPGNWCIDPVAVASAVSEKTRAIILTHFNKFVDLEPFYDLLKERGMDIPVIQDASLAVGSTLRGMHTGLFNLGKGGATVVSLATSKTISGLGGALVTTEEPAFLQKILRIAYQGFDFLSPDVLRCTGANVKMNDLNAVIALEQFRKHGRIFERRRELAKLYGELLGEIVEDGSIGIQDVGDEAILTHYAIKVGDRKGLVKKLWERHGVPTGLWHLHHKQKIYEKYAAVLPITDSLDNAITFLPFHTKLSNDDVRFICDAVKKELREG